jgi:prophage regulatory protein
MFKANTIAGRQSTITPPGPFIILRLPATKLQSGYSRSTIYLRITQGLWTKQVSLGPRAIGWPAHEVAALVAARISGKTDAEIRAMVIKLESARKAAD